MQADENGVDALRRVHRAASDRLDARPDPRVRAAVLAAAARGVDARPRRTTTPYRGTGSSRWPWSAAALLIVSVTTGLVATHVLRDDPVRETTIASIAPSAATRDRAAAPTASSDRAIASEPRPAPAPAAPAPTTPRRAMPQEPDRRSAARAKVARPEESASRGEASPPAPSALVATPAQEDRAADASSSAAPAPQAAPSASVTTAARARVGRIAEPATPEAWLARIAQLRRDGHGAEADRERDALRRRYPDFPMPDDVSPASGTR